MNLKIVTYNIQFGAGNIDQVADNIQNLAALGTALFCLQEIRQFDGQRANIAVITERLGTNWQWETFIKPNSHDVGLAILWRPELLDLVKMDKILLPKLSQFNFYENFFEKKISRIIDKPVQKGALTAIFQVGDRLLRTTNLHLDWQGHFIHRAEQLNFLVSHLNTPNKKADYEIICGDFNTWGAELILRSQERKIRRLLGPDFINVYPSAPRTQANFPQRLDYIFVRGAQPIKAEVLKVKGSDHLPIAAVLEI
jgi:endonuclease/exonuclease/phosphatase family metal-dependent hydrolase